MKALDQKSQANAEQDASFRPYMWIATGGECLDDQGPWLIGRPGTIGRTFRIGIDWYAIPFQYKTPLLGPFADMSRAMEALKAYFDGRPA